MNPHFLVTSPLFDSNSEEDMRAFNESEFAFGMEYNGQQPYGFVWSDVSDRQPDSFSHSL